MLDGIYLWGRFCGPEVHKMKSREHVKVRPGEASLWRKTTKVVRRRVGTCRTEQIATFSCDLCSFELLDAK